jgi:hypothetical protein
MKKDGKAGASGAWMAGTSPAMTGLLFRLIGHLRVDILGRIVKAQVD